MELSIIIPTLNEEEKIEKCLDSIFFQSLPPREVIIVDRYSSDRTIEIAKSYPRVRIFRSKANIGGARDLATRRASEEIIFSTDADAVLKRCDHLRRIESDFSAGEIVSWVGGIKDPDFWMQSWLISQLLRWGGACGANLAFRRNAYLAVNGFSHISAAEDMGLWMKLVRRYPGKQLYREGYEVEMSFNPWKWARGAFELSRLEWLELLGERSRS